MMVVMNALGYDAVAVGNHEFNFGLDDLWKAKREARFPILAANIKQKYKTGPAHFEPYTINRIAGVRVAIVGFATPVIPQWEIPAHYAGYEFEPIVGAARRVIPEVRKRADIVIVLAHSGLGPDPATGNTGAAYDLPNENAILALAEQVPGIDVILFGHTHHELPGRIVNGALLVQAKNSGASLARIEPQEAVDALRRAALELEQKQGKHTASSLSNLSHNHPRPFAIAIPAPQQGFHAWTLAGPEDSDQRSE